MGSTYKKIEGVQINGSNKYAGGQVYNASLNMSFNEKPNQITINVVSKDGVYTPPTLDLKTSVDIAFGNLIFKKMSAIRIKKSFSTINGNTLEITFTDSSFVLDKIWVGIPGKHGIFKHEIEAEKKKIDEYYSKNKGYMDMINDNKFVSDKKNPIAEMMKEKGENSSVFLIGRYFHPCDLNKDNMISPKEEKNIDPCDPCPYCPQDKYESKCFELGQTKLFEAGYSFKDLVDNWEVIKFPNQAKIRIKKPSVQKNSGGSSPDPYEFYYRDYHGPLREVLTSWASDFGLTWYLDPENDEIKFLDFNSKELNVDTKSILGDYSQQLISYELEESAENTTQIACISWYEREGERKNFDCSQSQAIALSPLVGADLIGNRIRDAEAAEGGTVALSVEDDIVGAMYGSYYPGLREVFWLRDRYKIKDAKTAAALITKLNLDTGFKDDGQPRQEKCIPELGDMAILAVAARNLKDTKQTKFQEFVNFKLSDLENSLTDSERETYFNNTGFFIVAYQNEDYLKRNLDLENELFNFVGRFHVRENLFRLCGITGSEEFVRNNTSIETADGSAQIYSKREGMDSSPLAQFKTMRKGYLACILSTGNIMSRDNFFKDLYSEQSTDRVGGLSFKTFDSKDYGKGLYYDETSKTDYGHHDSAHLGAKGNSVPIKLSQSVIILDRKAQWIPKPDDFDDYRRRLAHSAFSLLTLKELGNDGQIASSDWTKQAFGQEKVQQDGAVKSGLLGKIKIFLTYPGVFEAKVTRNLAHPTDRNIYEKQDYEKIAKRIGGRNGSLTKIGLLNSKCAKIETKINGKKIIPDIFTPPLTITTEKSVGNKIVDDEFDSSKKDTPCDKALALSFDKKNRGPSYKVILSQNFNQTIVLPKIQTGVNSGITAPDEIMHFNVNYNSVTNDEFIAFTGYTGYGCIPNLGYLEKINQLYSQYTISNLQTDKSVKLEIKSLPKFKKYEEELKRGLDSFSLSLSEQGATSNLSYSTKAARKISDDIVKWKNMIRYNSEVKGQ